MGVGECQDSGFCSFVFAQVRRSCVLSLSTLIPAREVMDDLCRNESESSGSGRTCLAKNCRSKGSSLEMTSAGGVHVQTKSIYWPFLSHLVSPLTLNTD